MGCYAVWRKEETLFDENMPPQRTCFQRNSKILPHFERLFSQDRPLRRRLWVLSLAYFQEAHTIITRLRRKTLLLYLFGTLALGFL